MVNQTNKSQTQKEKKEYLVQAWISESLLNQLEQISLKYGLTKAVLIRQALKQFLKDL